jgi:single-strand DNA-binding protein
MKGINQVFIGGNLGATPELRHTKTNNTPVTNLRVASSRKWRDANGELREETQWHSVTVWGAAAKACCDFLSKGSGIVVQGRLQYSSYETPSGDRATKCEVIAEDMTFTDNNGNRRSTPAGDFASMGRQGDYDEAQEDIPF